ncbi:T32E20.14 [Arabidopsis thaliana]|uniref:T32E20.14 n=1 Tax=Arabidopsis thaliana TaxID=3702 RepID=Q9LPA6_ARATH|nr:T32E20.14 [Arabidopsis thaliana]
MNPYANTSGFLDLVTSQQETSINVADTRLCESDAPVFASPFVGGPRSTNLHVVGSHAGETSRMASGMNENDLMRLAHEIYESDYNGALLEGVKA